MPPLDRGAIAADPAMSDTVGRFLAAVAAEKMPDAAADSLARAASPAETGRMIDNVLADSLPALEMAEHAFVAAGLQVHFARLAAALDPARLQRVADGVCPACGGPPVASVIVGWQKAEGARFAACPLCATLWHVVRIKCLVCESTEGIRYQEIEGGPGTVKAETCDACHSYVKILYQNKDHTLEPVADDVASLGLDLLMQDGPYRRAAFNPFLLGY
jgi:FdhE protein